MRTDEMDKLLRQIKEWVAEHGISGLDEKMKTFRVEYAKEQLRGQYPKGVVDLATVEMIDDKLTIYWKSKVPIEIRSEFLTDIEGEISICSSCEDVLRKCVSRLLDGENSDLEEETSELCENYWKQLSIHLER